MLITTKMMRELEEAIAEDAEAEVRIYAGGCDIRVRWSGGLKEVNQNLGAQQLSNIKARRDEDMAKAWKRLIKKFQGLRDMASKPR